MTTSTTAPPPRRAIVYKAPEKVVEIRGRSVFLAGSIEMGAAEDWQEKVTRDLAHLDVTIFNPRRENWDSSWEQRASNPKFREQVEWELDQQERCDIIAMYLDPNTKSPISLLELGLFSGKNKIVAVCCPDGYWRKGNVEMVCERYKIPLVNTLDELIRLSIDSLCPK